MKLTVHPAKELKGEASPPGSKSHTVRALFIATLARGTSHLHNVLDAEDGRAAMEVCQGLGAKIESKTNRAGGLDVTVTGEGTPLNTLTTGLFSANSGITTTIAVPIIGLRKTPIPLTLSSGEQMQKRPLRSIIQAVTALGMNIEDFNKNDSCPLGLSGSLEGGHVRVDGGNSQYLSALLLSLPCAPKDSEVKVENLQERPYVEMTLQWLNEEKIRYTHSKEGSAETFKIFGNQKYEPFTKTIPGDFSSASYLIVAAVLLPGRVTLHGLSMDDPQGDKGIIPILQKMGADIKVEKAATGGHILTVTGGKPLTGIIIDCGDIPDLLPSLAVIGTQAKGKTTLSNAAGARIKETDRIKSMAAELAKMGAAVEETDSSLTIHQSKLHHAAVRGHSDHRTIMALAIAGSLAAPDASGKTETTIDTAEGINKTFPNFADVMVSLGASIELTL